jgi:hypothetical protein
MTRYIFKIVSEFFISTDLGLGKIKTRKEIIKNLNSGDYDATFLRNVKISRGCRQWRT